MPVLAGHVSEIAAETAMVQLTAVVPAAVPVESTTCAENGNEPAVFGVPVIAPVAGFSVNPPGKLPAVMEYVNGGNPPPATKADVYGTPMVPTLAGHVRVIVSPMLMEQEIVTVPAAPPTESTTRALKLKTPAAVGVPVMAPVFASRFSPPGRLPELIEKT